MYCSAGSVLMWDTNREDCTLCAQVEQQDTLHVQEGGVLINGHSADFDLILQGKNFALEINIL